MTARDIPANDSAAKNPPAAEAPRLARGPVSVSSLIGRLTRNALGARGMAGADLLAQWSAIVGPELATLATPSTLKRERGQQSGDGATLVLRVASGAAATVLQLKGPQVVERVNRFFGYRAVARLQVVAGAPLKKAAPKATTESPSPKTLQEIERSLAHVQNPDLRTALARLGAAVRRRHGRNDAA
jgi:hypothetical protein